MIETDLDTELTNRFFCKKYDDSKLSRAELINSLQTFS
jgi:hypothetical protein